MPSDEYFCTLGLRVADVAFDLFDGRVVNQGTLRRTCIQSWRGLQLLYGSGQFFSKHAVNGVLHEQAVRADASLASVAVLRSDGAFDGGVQIRILKDNKWCVASELERKLFYGACALGHQDFADFGGPGERELSDDRIGREFGADFGGRARNNIQHAFGNAGAFGKFGECERGKRSLRGRFQDYGATGANGGPGLASDHGQWKIPRGDAGYDADRLFNNDDS